MHDNSNEHRLPPPAFPPGRRRHVHRNSQPSTESASDVHDLRPPAVVTSEEALIAPEDPIPVRRDPIELAFISPDEPIPERRIELAPAFAEHAPFEPDEEGVVVGMDLDAETEPMDAMAAQDRHVAELTDAVARLADALRRKGEAGLRSHADMGRFDMTLRAYCVGYLAGRRAEEPPTDFDV